MGWTGLAVYSGAYQTGVDGRILEDDHTSGGCRMVLDYLGNRTSDSENDKKSRNCRFGALAIGALITNVALKNIIARIRPYEVVEGLKLLIEPQSDFSFPSGHTCASIGAALAMYPFLERKWGIPLVILAVLISLSRLYVGVHYPTDVLGGAVVGVLAAWGAVRIVKRREIKGNREG